MDSTQKIKLKEDQKKWLTERDSFFEKTFNEFKAKNPLNSPYGSAFGAQDDAMFMYDDNAKFVMNRVLILIEKSLIIIQKLSS